MTFFKKIGIKAPDACFTSVLNEACIEEASCLSDFNIFINNGSRKSFSFGIGRDCDVEGGAHLKDEFIECKRLVEYAKTIAAFVCDWEQN